MATVSEMARCDFDNSEMSVVAGRVNPYPFVDQIRSAQENCGATGYAFIHCDDLGKYDGNLHYDTPSIVEMGDRFAVEMKRLDAIEIKPKSTESITFLDWKRRGFTSFFVPGFLIF